MFILKKVISLLVLPLNLCFAVLIFGFLLLLFSRKQKAAKILIGLGLVFFLVCSLPFVSNTLIRSLELRYPPVSSQTAASHIQWIVVLGGGNSSARPVGAQLSNASLARLVEAIRIYRVTPGRKLILSGGAVFDPVPNARAMFDTAKLLGVREADMVLESESWDTEDEARLIAPMLKAEPFFLVTSASHMPRSIALFKKQKMNPIAAPSDFGYSSGGAPLPLRILPNSAALQQSEKALREYLGMLWSRSRGNL